MERSVSWGELAVLCSMFEEAKDAEGIVFDDEELEAQAVNDFILQYIEGNDCPVIR